MTTPFLRSPIEFFICIVSHILSIVHKAEISTTTCMELKSKGDIIARTGKVFIVTAILARFSFCIFFKYIAGPGNNLIIKAQVSLNTFLILLCIKFFMGVISAIFLFYFIRLMNKDLSQAILYIFLIYLFEISSIRIDLTVGLCPLWLLFYFLADRNLQAFWLDSSLLILKFKNKIYFFFASSKLSFFLCSLAVRVLDFICQFPAQTSATKGKIKKYFFVDILLADFW